MGASGNFVNNNTISNSARYGIVLEASPYNPALYSTGNTISENTITSNARDGIYVGQDCNSNIITNNAINGATGTTEGSTFEANGIYFWKSSQNTVTDNTISNNVGANGNTGFGIEMHGSSQNTITSNVITGNLDGLHIRNINATEGYPAYNIKGNNISNNKIYGNTRVNLYANPNFDFSVENNWWGDADRAMVIKGLASWDLSGDIVKGTTVNLDFEPYYTDESMTTLSSSKSITGFSITGQVGETVINESTHTILVTMPYGANVNNLVPTITIAGSSVSPDSGVASDFTDPQDYTVTSIDGESSQVYRVSVNFLSAHQTAPDDNGAVMVNVDTPEVILISPTQAVGVTVTNGTKNPKINVSAFVTSGTGVLPEIKINSSVADVTLPDQTTVTGPSGWNGIIDAPTAGTPTGGQAPAGFSVGGTVISVGSESGTLRFDKAVTIVLHGITGTVGYRPSGSTVWHEITNVCTGYDNPTGAPLGGECAISNGTDTKILTFHFTSFGELLAVVAPVVSTTPIANVATTSSSEPETYYDDSAQADTNSSLDSQATLGSQTTNNKATDSTSVSKVDNGWSIFGLMWYWWLLIMAVIASAWCIVVAMRSRNDQNA
jgi:parallel beta-helix repeat protein